MALKVFSLKKIFFQDELLTVEDALYSASVRGRSAPNNPCLYSAKTRRWDAMTFQKDPSCPDAET